MIPLHIYKDPAKELSWLELEHEEFSWPQWFCIIIITITIIIIIIIIAIIIILKKTHRYIICNHNSWQITIDPKPQCSRHFGREFPDKHHHFRWPTSSRRRYISFTRATVLRCKRQQCVSSKDYTNNQTVKTNGPSKVQRIWTISADWWFWFNPSQKYNSHWIISNGIGVYEHLENHHLETQWKTLQIHWTPTNWNKYHMIDDFNDS